MIPLSQIPDEVVEAAYQRLYTMRPEDIRAAIAAALNAWPDRHIHEWQRPWLGGMSGIDLVLPLTENSND